MTKDAQAALRRTIETYSKITRFCLICNYVSRIIEPLASRCAKFRFKPLPEVAMRERLVYIAEQENLDVSDEVYTQLLNVSGGDMRKAVTTMQSVFTLCGNTGVTTDAVTEVRCYRRSVAIWPAGRPLAGALCGADSAHASRASCLVIHSVGRHGRVAAFWEKQEGRREGVERGSRGSVERGSRGCREGCFSRAEIPVGPFLATGAHISS